MTDVVAATLQINKKNKKKQTITCIIVGFKHVATLRRYITHTGVMPKWQLQQDNVMLSIHPDTFVDLLIYPVATDPGKSYYVMYYAGKV